MMIKEINNAFNNSGNKLLLIIWFSYWNWFLDIRGFRQCL